MAQPGCPSYILSGIVPFSMYRKENLDMSQPQIKVSAMNPSAAPSPAPSRTRLLQATLHLIATQGYSATSVDQICQRAGVTKGSFFHHFTGKDALVLEAVAYWQQEMAARYATARYHEATNPLDRLLGYLDLRAANLTGELADTTCPLGTLVQECYETHPEIRVVCERALAAHAAELVRDLAAAKRLCAPRAMWSAESVANFIESAFQGSFVLAKAKQSPDVVRNGIKHLIRYLGFLFQPEKGLGAEGAHRFDLQVKRNSQDSATQNAPLQSHFVD